MTWTWIDSNLNCTCDVSTQRFIGDATKQKVNTTFLLLPLAAHYGSFKRANAGIELWWSCILSMHKCWAVPMHDCCLSYTCKTLGWLSSEPRQLKVCLQGLGWDQCLLPLAGAGQALQSEAHRWDWGWWGHTEFMGSNSSQKLGPQTCVHVRGGPEEQGAALYF